MESCQKENGATVVQTKHGNSTIMAKQSRSAALIAYDILRQYQVGCDLIEHII